MSHTTTDTINRAVGTCPACGAGNAANLNEVGLVTNCTACNTELVLARVVGHYSDGANCDNACIYARGANCECSCAGWNHGSGYSAKYLGRVPEWVRKRDADAHAAKLAARAAKAAAARAVIAHNITNMVTAHPLLADLTYPETVTDNDFLTEIAERFTRDGLLTARQINAVERTMRGRIASAARAAKRAAAKANGKPAPLGRVEVTGEITWIRDEPNPFTYNSSVWKFIVTTADGWATKMTLPQHLIEQAMEAQSADQKAVDRGEQEWKGWDRYLLGRTVTLTATLALAKNRPDPMFAYGTRPTQARLAEPTASAA